jgi:hypothetical protein
MNRIFLSFFLAGLLMCGVAFAEDCNTAREAIVKMHDPEYASNAVWDSIYGAEVAQERFAGGMVLESGYVLAVGERFAHEDENIEVVIAQIDKYGRVTQELSQKVPGLRAIKKVISRKTGFIIAGRKRIGKGKSEIWLGFFDFGGKLLRAKGISESKFLLEPHDIVPLGNGYMLAASAEDRNGVHHTVIYRLDTNGNVINKKAFAPGLDNVILSLSPAGADQYMGSGYIRGDDGRKLGWLVMYNKDGEIIWERQYPRGKEAQITVTADYIQGFMIAGGESAPAGGGPRAGWVMMVDKDNGDIGWQRYYTGKLDFAARDILVSKTLFSVLLDGMVPDKSSEQSVVRLLTFNPRGAAFVIDKFINGEGVHGYKLLATPGGERIILGSTEMSYRVKKEVPFIDPALEKAGPALPVLVSAMPVEEEAPVLMRSRDGWVIAAIPVPPYEDPCAAPETPPQ